MGIGSYAKIKMNFMVFALLQCTLPTRSLLRQGGARFMSRRSLSIVSTGRRESLWVDREGAVAPSPPKADRALKIVSYNVLGAKHGEGNKHDYAPDRVTRWTYRRDKLVEELQELNADIYCLQEVTERGLRETFIPALESMGLTCAGFAPARDDRNATSSAELSRNTLDHYTLGCAIFCDPRVAEMVSSKRVFLKDFALGKSCRSADFQIQVLQKMNTIVMVLLKLVGTDQCVIVANTHLFWDPSRDDIKAIQAFAAAEAISRFSSVLGYTTSNPPPLIFCGDFNAMPTCSGRISSCSATDGAPVEDDTSAIFKLLTSGELSSSHPQHPDQWYSRVASAPICPRIGPLRTQWKLQNAYRIPEFAPYAPAFTTKTNDFAGWIDHIWVNDQVTVSHALVPPVCDATGHSSGDFPPIPNSDYASDHIPLGIIATIKDSPSPEPSEKAKRVVVNRKAKAGADSGVNS